VYRDIVNIGGAAALAGLTLVAGTGPATGQEMDQQQQKCELQGSEILNQAEELLNTAAQMDSVESQQTAAQQQFDQAWKRIQLSLRQDSVTPAAYFMAARAQIGMGDYAAADSMLKRFTSRKPACGSIADNLRFQGWADAYNRGIRNYQAGSDSVALASFERANLLRNDARSLNNAAILHQKLGNLEKAEELYRTSLETVADDDTAQIRTASINLAELLRNQGNAEETRSIYENYLQTNPADVQARINYSAGLQEAGQNDSAQAVLESVMNREDLTAKEWYDIGYSLMQMKSYSRAVTAFDKARQAAPFDKATMERLMTVNVGAGNYGRATSIGDTLLEWYPYEKEIFRAQMQALDRAGNTQQVQQLLPRIQNMPVIINRVSMQQQGENQYVISGQVQGGTSANQTVTIPFELIDAQGQTVATKEAEVTVPGQNQSSVFQVAFQTDGSVAGFRYRSIQ